MTIENTLADNLGQFENSWFRDLAEAAPVLLYYASPEGRLVWMNQMMRATLGVSIGEMNDRPAEFRIHEDDRDQVISGWKQAIENRRPFQMRYRYLRPGGELIWLSSRVTPDLGPEGKIKGFIGSVTEITKEVETEVELRESQLRYQLLYNATPVMMHVLDSQYRMSEVSDYWLEVSGYSREQVVGRELMEFITEESKQSLLTARKRLSENGFVLNIPVQFVHKDGSVLDMILAGFRDTGEDGQTRKVFGAMLNVTERNRTERELAEERARVLYNAKLASVGEMSASMAHEINNPLSIILGNAQVLKTLIEQGSLSEEKILKVADRIERTVKRISKIVRGLKSVARVGEGDPTETVLLSTLIDDLLAICQSRLHHHGVELRQSAVPEGLSLECRPVQISQVLLNLLNNARDAVESQNEKWIQIEARDLGSQVEIAITDSGRGIPAEIAERIMEPFFTTKNQKQGTGLGLSISKGLVESHGGSLRLDSASPRTRFVISLPKTQKH